MICPKLATSIATTFPLFCDNPRNYEKLEDRDAPTKETPSTLPTRCLYVTNKLRSSGQACSQL